jgi:hypothetical protein
MTIHRSVHTLLGTLTATAALVALVAPPASASIVESGPIHETPSGTIENFCGAAITVAFAATVDGRYQVNSRGPGGPDYYLQKTTVVTVYTGPLGETATDIQPNTINKDLSLVDDPVAGTLTIVALLTGGERTYGNTGKLIAKNSGQIRLGIVYDYVHDVELSNVLVKESTGTNDDFCAAVLTDWGYPST